MYARVSANPTRDLDAAIRHCTDAADAGHEVSRRALFVQLSIALAACSHPRIRHRHPVSPCSLPNPLVHHLNRSIARRTRPNSFGINWNHW